MIETKSPEINVEDLMRQIRQEILKQKSSLDQPSVSLVDESRIAEKTDYEIVDFLVYEDEAFIKNAYRGILRREPDETGYVTTLSRLRENPASKLSILINLRFSPEGKNRGVLVHGLLKSYLEQKYN